MTPKSLFPKIKPFNKSLLDVGEGHKVYFEECGNPDGIPILFFHGGPGAGCDEKNRRFFNPQKWRVILFDQRGCGKSRPLGLLKNNTTWHLIQDAKQILDKLGISKTALFGGSWGSTMALIFSITYPNMVLGMVIRGIFLGELSEIDYSENGLMATHLPKEWEKFISVLRPEQRKNPISSYYKELIKNQTGQSRKRKLAYEWTRYEYAHLRLAPRNLKNYDKYYVKEKSKTIETLALLEIYYIVNRFFLKKGFILNNAPQIPNVPISIIHGEYDIICPTRNAYRLEKALLASGHTKVRTFYTFAGHSSSDPENQKKLLIETERMYNKIKTAL